MTPNRKIKFTQNIADEFQLICNSLNRNSLKNSKKSANQHKRGDLLKNVAIKIRTLTVEGKFCQKIYFFKSILEDRVEALCLTKSHFQP